MPQQPESSNSTLAPVDRKSDISSFIVINDF